VMPQYFQDVGGSDPLGTGVRLLPMIGGMIVATRIGPGLVKRAGAQTVIVAGLVLCTAALGLAATTDVDTAYAFAAVWITLLGAGIGLVLPASVGAAIGALSPDRAGSGSGLMQALRQVGATIGVAVLGTVLSSGYHARLDDGDVPSAVEDAVRSSVGAGIEVARQLDSSALAQTVRSAFVHGMDTVMLASAALTMLGAVIAVLYLPRRAAETPAPASRAEAPVREAAVAG
jgi:MFS transporter, DHA2 family, multidrug resistance protein